MLVNILSRASEAGSPTSRLGSGQRLDTDQGPFSPSPDGLGLTLMGSLQPAEFHNGSTGFNTLTDHLKIKNTG